MFSRMDDFLIDRVFQPITDRVCTPDRTPCLIAAHFMLAAAGAILIYVLMFLTDGAVGQGMIGAILIPTLLWNAHTYKKQHEKDAGAPTSESAVPPFRLHQTGLRAVMVLMTIMLWLIQAGLAASGHFEWGDVSFSAGFGLSLCATHMAATSIPPWRRLPQAEPSPTS